MGILDKLFNIESASFKTIKEPTFIKEFSKENLNISTLEEMYLTVDNEAKKEQINKELAMMKIGLNGENVVCFELKNCDFPILCLHDIRIEYDDLTAQMDYIVITKKYICVLETKQLQGNVNINSDGDFIRVYKDKKGFETKTGMYSPVEQNKKHVNLLRRMLKDKFGFDNVPIKSLIVMANPKAIIKKSYAPQEIQDQIIRAEKLGDYLKNLIESIGTVFFKEETAFKIANFLKEEHKPIAIDYKKKFGLAEADFIEVIDVEEMVNNNISTNIINGDNVKDEENIILSGEDKILEEALKQYRKSKAKEQGLEHFKYHFIFSNAVVLELIKQKTETVEKLYSIKGLGKSKIDSYGSDIINIINQHRNAKKEETVKTKSSVSVEDGLRERLKQYRFETAKKENIKAYFIFNNEQMEDILATIPKTKEELLKIKGFGEVKVQKYGDGILEIFYKGLSDS
jgi:hypothetical protein